MQTKAIILKKQNTNEYDQWITCYTEDFGKLMAVAKSILKPSSIQGLHLDTFNLVEFDLINGRGMPIITGAQVVNTYIEIKNSLARTAVAYFFAEAVDKMVFEGDKDENLWNFLVSFLSALNEESGDPILLFQRGQSRLLDILGYFPEVDSCKACSGDIDANSSGAFNYDLGGVVCKRCFLSGYGGILINRDDFNLLSGMARTFNEKKYRRSVLDGMFEYIYGSKFSSLDLLNVIK